MTEEVNDVSAPVEESVQTDAAVEQTTEVESSPTEQTEEQATTEVATTEEAEQVEEQTEASETPEEQLAPKSQNRFQKLANENRELKNRIAELEQFKVPTEQDYIDGGYDPVEAKLNAIEARVNQRDQVDQVASLNNAVQVDMVRIINEYPQLNPKSKEFSEDLAKALFNQYDKDAQTQYAEDGIVLDAKQLPYEYIKEKMELIGLASKQASVKAQKSVEKMVAVAETPTGKVAPKAPKEMSTKELEDSLGMVYY